MQGIYTKLRKGDEGSCYKLRPFLYCILEDIDGIPDRTFHNFQALKFGDQQILCNLNLS